MSELNLKIGDLVVLKSGGPIMTVNKIIQRSPSSDNQITTAWFVKTTMTNATFSENALRYSTEEDNKTGRDLYVG